MMVRMGRGTFHTASRCDISVQTSLRLGCLSLEQWADDSNHTVLAAAKQQTSAAGTCRKALSSVSQHTSIYSQQNQHTVAA